LNSQDILQTISAAIPNGQAASCWISMTRSGHAFVSNTVSATLSSYQISADGTANLATALSASLPGGARNRPCLWLSRAATSAAKRLNYKASEREGLGLNEAAEQELSNERNMRNLCHRKQSSDPSKNSGNNQAENAK